MTSTLSRKPLSLPIFILGLALCWNTKETVATASSIGSSPTVHCSRLNQSYSLDFCISRGGSLDESKNSFDNSDVVEQKPSRGETDSQSLVELATTLRLKGKEYHDEGNFAKAAEIFQEAADTLLSDEDNSLRLSDDYATCRLHQALCHLKSENYERCIDACTDVLQDRSSSSSIHSPAINARAYHRRAKAKMALGDNAGALQDARTASFLGDGKAVNLYGKLMRESSSSDLMINPLLSTSSSGDTSSSLSSPHSQLFESLLNKSSERKDGIPDFSPASLLMGNGGANNMLGALGGSGGMAKSVVQNLLKKLDDRATQETICNLLQRTDKAQLSSLASMAGVGGALEDNHLDRLVKFCHGVTPKGIRRTIKGAKVIFYVTKVIRRTIKVVQKYKSLIVVAFVLQWTKSATLRPLPINTKAAKRAAKLAAKEALKDAMKASRAGFF